MAKKDKMVEEPAARPGAGMRRMKAPEGKTSVVFGRGAEACKVQIPEDGIIDVPVADFQRLQHAGFREV